jgi:urease accessory protein
MIIARKIIGKVGDKMFAGRGVDWIDVPSFEATKRIMRCKTESGTEISIELPRGSYLSDGAVVADTGDVIIAIRRQPEDALVIRFDSTTDTEMLVEDVAKVAHAFGNQHIPMEVHGLEIRVPITTSQSVMEHTLEHIGLRVAEASFTKVSFALEEPQGGSHHEH